VSATASYDERINRFHDSYGNEGDPASPLADYAIKAGNVLALIVGERLAAEAMSPIAASLGGDGGDWRRTIENGRSGAFSDWQLGARLHDLFAFARYGISVDASSDEDAGEIQARIEDLLSEAEEFLVEANPDHWIGTSLASELTHAIGMARARLALDKGRAMSSSDLACLGGVSASRMRAMLSGEGAQFHRDSEGRVPAHEALAWLETRADFYPSIWRDQRPSREAGTLEERIEDPVIIPVSADGSRFTPDLDAGKGFYIGPTKGQRRIFGYDEALTELLHMSPPRWRRPAPKSGKMSTVTGTGWVRMSREELFS
jgi:hypothetical protein